VLPLSSHGAYAFWGSSIPGHYMQAYGVICKNRKYIIAMPPDEDRLTNVDRNVRRILVRGVNAPLAT